MTDELNDKKPDPRPPGTGCLKYRGKDAKGKEVWGCRVAVGRDSSGKRISVNHTVHGTKTKAQKWITDKLSKKDLGIPTFESKVTLGKYLDEWLIGVAKPRVSERTHSGYESLLMHVKNSLGSAKLSRLRAEDIQRLYGTLTSSTARHIHAPLRSALKQAFRWQLIHTNPADAVELPKHRAREMQALTQAEVRRLLAVERFTRTEGDREVTVENKFGVLFAFLLEIGARPSEALGLTWSDVDMEKATVTIQRTLQWHVGRGKGHYFGEPKTKKSRRSVTLSSNLVRQLRQHRAVQAEALLKLGIKTDLIFANSEGMPIMRKNLVRRHFKHVLKAAGLPADFTLYCLRHTCISLQLANGVHPKVVSERAGHSTTTMTLDVYGHNYPGMQEAATVTLEKVLYG